MKNIRILLAMMAGVLPQNLKSLPSKRRWNTGGYSIAKRNGKQECARRVRQMKEGKCIQLGK